MQSLFDPERHEALAARPWSDARVRDEIAAICRDAEAAFDRDRLWPLHPGDDDPLTPRDGILRGLYVGAAGMLHALARLAEAGLHEPRLDGAAVAAGLHEAALASPDEKGAGESLLLGSSGILLVAHRLAPSTATADALARRSARTPITRRTSCCSARRGRCSPPARCTLTRARSGSPSSGAAARARSSRARSTTACGRRISTANGIATSGPDTASPATRWRSAPPRDGSTTRPAVEARAVAAARALAVIEGDRASWPTLAAGSPNDPPPRVQWCHGAAGIVTSLAALAPADEAHGALMTAGGELVWHAGPVAHNAGCATGPPATASPSWRC